LGEPNAPTKDVLTKINMKNIFFLSSFLFISLSISAQTKSSRQYISFNNGWQFRKAPAKNSDDTSWKQVTIPHTWNAVDMQTGKDFYAGDAFYRKQFFPDKKLEGKRIFIRFDGVGQVADLYVNDKFIGEHKGSYSAFCFEITYALKYGTENLIQVKVNNAPRKDVVPINNFLFAIYGGIYRPVAGRRNALDQHLPPRSCPYAWTFAAGKPCNGTMVKQ
jgi:beta-galactosidase